MPSNSNSRDLRFLDDIGTVTGLKGTDSVLLVGDNATFPGLDTTVASVELVGSTPALIDMLQHGRQFDKVFIARENMLDERVVLAAATLSGPAGLVCFFSEDDGLRAAFRHVVELHFPGASVWDFRSNVGSIVVTDARAEG